MPSPTTRGYPYPPLTGVTADVPRDMQALAEAVDVDVSDHEAAKTGVHGFPAMGATGRGLIWDGSGWVATNVAEQAGLNGDGVVRRGKSIIATEESRTNTAYGTLATPDQVANVVLPTDGLIVVAFQALVKESVVGAASIALFIGANQLTRRNGAGAPLPLSAIINDSANNYNWAMTTQGGTGGELVSVPGAGDSSSVTTGMVAAELIAVEAAAGTYTISVQYKATSGSVTAKERKLWVEAKGY